MMTLLISHMLEVKLLHESQKFFKLWEIDLAIPLNQDLNWNKLKLGEMWK